MKKRTYQNEQISSEIKKNLLDQDIQLVYEAFQKYGESTPTTFHDMPVVV